MRAEADEAFRAALKLWPDDPGVSQVAVDYYETTGRPELAEAALRHLLAIRPGFDWARRRLALNLSARLNNPAALSEAMSLLGPASPAPSRPRTVSSAPSSCRAAPTRSTAPRRSTSSRRWRPRCSTRRSCTRRWRGRLLASSEQARAGGDAASAAADRARALGHAAKAAAGEKAPADVILFDAVLRLQEKDTAGAPRGARPDREDRPEGPADGRAEGADPPRRGEDPGAEALVRAAFDAHKATPEALGLGVGLLKLLIDAGSPGRGRGARRRAGQGRRPRAGSPSPSTSPAAASRREARGSSTLAGKAGPPTTRPGRRWPSPTSWAASGSARPTACSASPSRASPSRSTCSRRGRVPPPHPGGLRGRDQDVQGDPRQEPQQPPLPQQHGLDPLRGDGPARARASRYRPGDRQGRPRSRTWSTPGA